MQKYKYSISNIHKIYTYSNILTYRKRTLQCFRTSCPLVSKDKDRYITLIYSSARPRTPNPRVLICLQGVNLENFLYTRYR